MQSFKIDPASTNTFNSTTLDSLESFSYDETCDVTQLGSDGKMRIQYVGTDNLAMSVTVVGYDVGYSALVGTVSTLVLNAIEHASGSGITGTKIVHTFSNAVLTNTSRSVNHAGNSTVTYNFVCASPDGTTIPLALS